MSSQPPAARVYLLSPKHISSRISAHAAACFDQLQADFTIQSTTAHTLVADPDSADFILAPIQDLGYGPSFELLRRSSLYREHAQKVIVYSTDANQFPGLRGLYPAAPRRWVRRGWALPAHYISTHFPAFSFTPEEIHQKDILFSFVGSSRTHPLRESIVRWRHPRGVLIDSSARGDKQYWWEKPNKKESLASFREISRRSKFVICPRGVSPSSIRLFEAMEAGAAPVIVADDLELPPGPTWDEFALSVRERDVDDIPALLERRESAVTEMGAAARRAWEAYFSPQATVGSVVAGARLLLSHPVRRPMLLRAQEYASPPLVKAKLRHGYHHWLHTQSA